MEITLYFGKQKKTFMVSKFIDEFIIGLNRMQELLGKPNDYEILRMERRGKLYNYIIVTQEKELPSVVKTAEIKNGLHFMAKRTNAIGYSKLVLDADYQNISKGMMTLILKDCENPKVDGYYINAFWGEPFMVEPFIRYDSPENIRVSKEFWNKHAFRAEAVKFKPSEILITKELTEQDKNTFGKLGYRDMQYIGRANLKHNYRDLEITHDGQYYIYRGN